MDPHIWDVLVGGVWCPQCYAGLRGRCSAPGHLGVCRPSRARKDRAMKFVKKAAAAADAAPTGYAASAGDWSARLPALSEFLTANLWDDGTARVPGTLTLFTDDGAWKLCLSDKDGGRIAFVTGRTPGDVFAVAEKDLASDTLGWRPQRAQGGKGRRS